jgi:hypothetical protein
LVQLVRLISFFSFEFFIYSCKADIIELFEAFKEHGVQRNLTIVHLILAAWSISLMQFTLVVTSTKSRKKIKEGAKQTDTKEDEKCFSCRLFWETELWVKYLVACFYNISFNLGAINYNSFTRWSISLPSSGFNYSL